MLLSALGVNALTANLIGTQNVAIGLNALAANTDDSNTAIGGSALAANVGGSTNVAIGKQAMDDNVSGDANTGVGTYALTASTSDDNTGVGYSSLGSTIGGAGNTALGRSSGYANTTGSNNTFIGYNAGNSGTSSGLSNATAIGYNTQVTASNSLILGNGANVGIGMTAPGGKLEVEVGASDAVIGFLLDTNDTNQIAMQIQAAQIDADVLDIQADALTTARGIDLSLDALTSGYGMVIEAAGAARTITGDLFRINLGASPTLTGKFLSIEDNGSDVFTVGTAQIESAVPHSFTAAGDVTMAYDLEFTNQTASSIISNAPLTIDTGESFESNNLTLKTYNSGDIVFDIPSSGAAIFQGAVALDSQQTLSVNDTTPTVAAGSYFITANTSGTLISDFDDGHTGQIIAIEIGSSDTFTDFDCTASGIICGGTNITEPATDDVYTFIYNGADWHLLSSMDADQPQTGSDIAEYFPSNVELEAGDVVSISTENPAEITKSSSPYDQAVLGVVSTDPEILLGEKDGDNYYPVALVGRVPVKIDPISSPINKGDFVTTSSETGKGMRAEKAGRVIGTALDNWTPGTSNDTVVIFINNTWFESIQVAGIDDLNIVALEDPLNTYEIQDSSGGVIDTVGAFAEAVIANIQAGAATVTELIANRGRIDELETQIISPVADGDIVIDLERPTTSSGPSGFGKLLVKGRDGEVVFSVDEVGNTTISGELAAEEVEAPEIIVGKIYADEIIARTGTFADIASNTYSGITREEIEELLAEAETDRDLLADAEEWNINTATAAGYFNELALENLFVTGIAAMDTLSLTNSLTVGTDLVISTIRGDNSATSEVLSSSIDTLSAPLSIQSSAAQPLHLMAGLVTIDTNGDVSIDGNLFVAGQVESAGLTLRENAESGFGKLLSLVNDADEEVAVITASGAAEFASIEADKITLTDDPTATSSASFAGLVYSSSATAGTARVPSGSREVIIRNPNITVDSLVFVTPTSSTLNPLFIKEQSEGEIMVGFDIPANSDVTFNWWLVELVADATE